MDVEIDQLRFEDINSGGVLEELNAAIERVIQDLGDPNAQPGAVRKITVTIAVRPDKGLTSALIQAQVATKLAQPEPSEGMVFLSVRRGGRVVAESRDRLQPTLDETAAGPVGIVNRGHEKGA